MRRDPWRAQRELRGPARATIPVEMGSIALEPLQAGPSLFSWGTRTYVIGIINATPDSFSGDGVNVDLKAALRLAEQQLRDGADIIDVGGESTRPGAEPVPAEEEIR